MKEFKGTPGPWHWTSDVFNDGNILHGEAEQIVFWGDNICGGITDDDGWGARLGAITSDIISFRDAKLIAAAPELLEALQKLLSEYENIIWNEWSSESDEDTIRAHAAINKALGEEK